MSNLPIFSHQGYQVKRELGHNHSGGRVTYLATDLQTEMPVVIKQFQFANPDSNWSDYEAYEREIQCLQQLKHPSIPLYLGCFQTPSGCCLVQDYKNAPSLANPHPWTLAEIKQIAIAVLETLVYLQQQNPPLIHRDIKPENILVERQQDKLNVYLVDFGFARSGGGEVAGSSAVKGTLGFMPPEQLFNKTLTEASDLYSLGATLICLFTQTPSQEIGKLIDDSYTFNIKKILPNLEPEFIAWLEKMMAPNSKERYANAAIALQALQSINIAVKDAVKSAEKKPEKFKNAAATFGLVTLGTFAGVGIWIGFFAAMISIGNRSSSSYSNYYAPPPPDYSQTAAFLVKTRQCPECTLKGVRLANSVLVRANLWKADLSSATLTNAYLMKADLRGAQLQYANLTNAQLREANLGYAFLVDANLENANLKSSNLWSANLEKARLENANLEKADLEGAKLTKATLLTANLAGANLTEASLDQVDLRGANLSHANLRSAYFRGANLRGANLRGAKIRGANFRDADLKGAIMPDGSIHK